MATRPEDVTEIRFYGFKDVMRITGYGRGKAYRIIREMNEKLAKQGKMVFDGKIAVSEFNAMF